MGAIAIFINTTETVRSSSPAQVTHLKWSVGPLKAWAGVWTFRLLPIWNNGTTRPC